MPQLPGTGWSASVPRRAWSTVTEAMFPQWARTSYACRRARSSTPSPSAIVSSIFRLPAWQVQVPTSSGLRPWRFSRVCTGVRTDSMTMPGRPGSSSVRRRSPSRYQPAIRSEPGTSTLCVSTTRGPGGSSRVRSSPAITTAALPSPNNAHSASRVRVGPPCPASTNAGSTARPTAIWSGLPFRYSCIRAIRATPPTHPRPFIGTRRTSGRSPARRRTSRSHRGVPIAVYDVDTRASTSSRRILARASAAVRVSAPIRVAARRCVRLASAKGMSDRHCSSGTANARCRTPALADMRLATPGFVPRVPSEGKREMKATTFSVISSCV